MDRIMKEFKPGGNPASNVIAMAATSATRCVKVYAMIFLRLSKMSRPGVEGSVFHRVRNGRTTDTLFDTVHDSAEIVVDQDNVGGVTCYVVAT